MSDDKKSGGGLNIGNAMEEALKGAGATQSTAATPKARRSPGARQAVSASDVLSRYGRSATLSTDAREYVKGLEADVTEIMSTLTGKPAKITFTPVPCEMVPILRCCIQGTINILVAFTDTYHPPIDAPYTPPSRYMAEAARDLINSGVSIATTLVVTPESYALRPIMARFLTNAALSQLTPDFQIDLASLANDSFVVRTRLADVRQAIQDNYPVATIPPFDIGMAIYTAPTEKGGKSQLLLALGATTVFVATSQTGVGHAGIPQAATPVTVITVMVQPAPSLSMTIFGLSLAADGFFSRQMWRDQFSDFRKGEPNIGNLISDMEGKPYHVGDAYTLQEFIQTKLQPQPLLAIDIADGAPRVCGMELICANMVNQDVSSFLNQPIEMFTCGISGGVHMQYTGMFGDGTDTRAVSYLKLCAEDPSNVAAYIPMLVRNTNPAYTLNAMGELYSNQKIIPLYTCNRTIINAAFLNMITSHVSPQITITWETDSAVINNAGRLPTGDVAAFGVSALYGNTFGGGANNYPQVLYRV